MRTWPRVGYAGDSVDWSLDVIACPFSPVPAHTRGVDAGHGALRLLQSLRSPQGTDARLLQARPRANVSDRRATVVRVVLEQARSRRLSHSVHRRLSVPV